MADPAAATAAAAAAATDAGFSVGGVVTWCIEHPYDMPLTFVYSFAALFLFDVLFARKLYDVVKTTAPAASASAVGAGQGDSQAKSAAAKKRIKPQKSRWFAVHVFANIIVCIASLRAIFTTLVDPAHSADGGKYSDTSMFGDGTQFPLVMIITVHFYHMAIFDDLSSADYFHHLMFIPTMGIPGLLYKWGPALSFLCFFISGLPGGIEYFFLTLSKIGFVTDRSFLKRVAAMQNTWCRWPGILLGSYNIYMGWVYGSILAPWYWAVLIGGLSSFNAIYYGFQSISALTKDSIVAQYKKEGAKMFEQGGRSIKVNRPGS